MYNNIHQLWVYNLWLQAYLSVLHFIALQKLWVLCVCVFPYKLKVYDNPMLNNSFGTIFFFSNSICSLISLSHILVILTVCQTFSLLFYLSWWSVILGVTIITCWRLRCWLAFLTIKYFWIKVCTYFRYNAIAYLTDYSLVKHYF